MTPNTINIYIFNQLKLKNVFKEKNERFYIYPNKINASQDIVYSLLINLIKNNYKLEEYGKKSNRLTLQYESVDAKKVLPLLKKIYENSSAEIREILANPENMGGDIIWAGMIYDSLLTLNEQQKEIL